jgi:branched-chain amino acid transport system ATP-binding protein
VSAERPLLAVTDLHVAYGAIRAVEGISFEVPAGSVVTLIGANGAGKSTTLNAISGVLKPHRGRVVFDGADITGFRANRVAARGLLQVPEGRQVLAPLSVEENLLMGAYLRRDRQVASDLQRLYDQFPRLAERRAQMAGSLSGGEQQMLATARALMACPTLLMLDEPSWGLAPILVRRLFETIIEINRQGVAILLVEQNVYRALSMAHQAYVLERGSLVMQGGGKELLEHPELKASYLGL